MAATEDTPRTRITWDYAPAPESADHVRLRDGYGLFIGGEFVDPRETIARNLRDAGLDPDDQRFRQFATLWNQMQDLPRHLGQHSGGMVMCQGRLDDVVPLENASMPGRVVTAVLKPSWTASPRRKTCASP